MAERLTKAQRRVLQSVATSMSRGAVGKACNGADRDPANQLVAAGMLRFLGHVISDSSSYYAVTPAGRSALNQPEPGGRDR